MSEVACAKCGAPITGEGGNAVPALEQRPPCPKCGSFSRTVGMTATLTGAGGITASLSLIHHSQSLIANARRLFADCEYSLAVVVAHTACEVGVERALSQAYRKRGIEDLEEALDDMLGNFNISHSKVQKFFKAMTGEPVTDKPCWGKLKESATKRNRIVHRGLNADANEAQASLDACGDLVAWLISTFG